MSNRNPNSTEVEKEYVFEIHGEIVVSDYSEKQAEEQLHNDLASLIREAMSNEAVEIK